MKTIGVVFNTIISEYEELLWRELVYQSMHEAYNVIYFSYGGHRKNRHHLNAQRNSIIEFINQNAIDGLIVFSAAIGFMATREDMHEFLKSFEPIPLVSIGYAYNDIPSITISNTKGLQILLDEHKASFECLVCANDAMAFGAMKDEILINASQ
jgi:DNA-binding LacI/PurR family transcriptional regulator